MRQYLQLLRDIKEYGVFKGDRTGTGTQSLFGAQSRYDLREGFPLMTTKKMFTRGIFEELLWFIRGSTNVRELQEKKVKIWDEWTRPGGHSAGPVYGKQWRHWGTDTETLVDDVGNHLGHYRGGRDQLLELIARIKEKPDDRRLIVTAWNPDEVPLMALPSCHILFQCWTRELTLEERGEWAQHNETKSLGHFGEPSHDFCTRIGIPRRGLTLQLYQRSCDVFLGVPFNIASYALLTHMIAQVCGMVALEFVHTYGDVHIYNNHREQVDLQLAREPKPLPKLWLDPTVKNIDDFRMEHIKVEGYEYHPKIRAEVSV